MDLKGFKGISVDFKGLRDLEGLREYSWIGGIKGTKVSEGIKKAIGGCEGIKSAICGF